MIKFYCNIWNIDFTTKPRRANTVLRGLVYCSTFCYKEY